MRSKTFSSIQVESQLKHKIEFLTKVTGSRSQNTFLDSVISPLFETGSFFSSAELEAYPLVGRQNVVFQFYKTRNNKISFGQNKPIEVAQVE